jgi:hypothetical protein
MLCSGHYFKLISVLKALEMKSLPKNSEWRELGDCIVCEGRMSMFSVLGFVNDSSEPVEEKCS